MRLPFQALSGWFGALVIFTYKLSSAENQRGLNLCGSYHNA